MKQFNAAHLEVKKTFKEGFQTHPYECGWADEAIFYILVEDMKGENAELKAKVQISLDGIHWAEEGTEFAPIRECGLHFVKVREFGNYIRLATEISGRDAEFKLLVQIACKG